MKPSTLLLAASLLANVALVSVFVLHTSTPPKPPVMSGGSKKNADAAAKADALRKALESGNAAALEAAGLSPELARELALGRMFSGLGDKLRASQAKSSSDDGWWRNRPGANAGTREQQLALRRELANALAKAFGDDFGLGGGDGSPLGFLSAEKREALRRILQDYEEMFAKFGAGGIQLASDREKLRLLRQERERDIAGLLTPDELLAYEMRTSSSGNAVRARYGDAIESEAEFQKIFALQKVFDEKFSREALVGRISPEVMRARSEAERQLEADIRATVGADRYAALRRAADPDVRNLDSLASRLNLPPATTDQVLGSRDLYSAESQRIAQDTSLTVPQRREQIQALAAQAKSQVGRALGTEAADAYSQRSPWMNMLQNGMAFATTPPEGSPGSFLPGGQSVFPVPVAGANTAGAQRNFVFTADAPAGPDAVGGGNVQVMTFSTSTTVDSTGTPAAGTAVRQIIATPGQPVPPPASATPTPPPPRR